MAQIYVILECCCRYNAWTDELGVLRVLCPKCHAVGRLIQIGPANIKVGED